MHEPSTPAEPDIEQRMTDLAANVERLEARSGVPYPISAGRVPIPSSLTPFNWFRSQVEALAENVHTRREQIDADWLQLRRAVNDRRITTRDFWPQLQTRALADITGGETQAGDNTPTPNDISGLVVEQFLADQLVNVLDRRRPIFANLGSFPMPRSGYAVIPTITQNTEVSARGSQKTEVPSQAMRSENTRYEAGWLAGAVDIAIEVIRSADVDVLKLIWDDLLGQYARATELDSTHGVVPFIEAGGHGFAYTGTALDLTDYKTFIDDVLDAADDVLDATGEEATLLFVTRAQFRTIAGFVDGQGRPQFPVLGGVNTDTARLFTDGQIALPGGPTVIKAGSDDLTQAFLTNEDAFKVSDSGPELVQAINVALMGEDIGVLGRTMLVPRIPTGVVVFGSDPES